MTNTTTQPSTNGTVVISGRTYTHKTQRGEYAREIDVLSGCKEFPHRFAILLKDREIVRSYTGNLRNAFSSYFDLPPIPATTTRPRELKDVVAELAKGGVPWVKYPEQEVWQITPHQICNKAIEHWNKDGVLFSPNPFQETPTIVYPEITEEVKP